MKVAALIPFSIAFSLTLAVHGATALAADTGAPDASTPLPQADAPLRVLVAGSPPFVTETDKTGVSGLSVEVWRRVAQKLGKSFRLERVGTVNQAIDRVAAGGADVAIGPISITAARARRVAFSQPYFDSSLSILAPAKSSLLDRIRPFLTRAFLGGIGLLLCVLLLVGTLIWWFERKSNAEHFPERPLSGIGNGIWMALVTMTTVGYGDRVPQSTVGRIITGIWMTASMIVASSLTAFMATALTLSQIDRPGITTADDLHNRRVGVVRGTTSERFVTSHRARAVAAPNLDVAVKALVAKKTDAVVFDRPMLRYYLREHPDLDLRLASAEYQPQGYGLALPPDSPLRAPIDVALLELQALGELDAMAEDWLGP